MAQQNGFQKFLKKTVRFINGVVTNVKKMDKRFLMMLIAAVALLIVILALIIHSVGANKSDENEDTTVPSSYITEEPSTEDEPAVNTVIAVGAGKYKIDTGSDSPLNMRPTAGTDYGVITTIPNGTQVDVLFVDDSSEDKWGYIEYGGSRGWVAMEYLKAE